MGEEQAEKPEPAAQPAPGPVRHVWSSRRKRIAGPTQYVRVSMSEFERARLLALEARTGLSPSAILVDAALGTGDPVSLQLRRQQVVLLLEIRRLVATAANNANQVARHQNSTGEVAAGALAAVAEARAVMTRVVEVIEELRP